MDVSLIIARLVAECPTIAQVIEPPTGGTLTPIATQASLYTLLSGLVSTNMYPLQLPENPTHPSIVYQMVSSTPGVFEGYHVTHTDLFILNLRGDDYDVLITLTNSVIAALAGENIEVTDILHDYDQSENLFRVNLEISYSYINAASQTMPAAFVYPLTRAGNESAYDNYTKQLVAADYAVLIVTADGNISALQDEIQAALVGWQQTTDYWDMEYGSGAAIEGVGGLEVWREQYRDAFYMTQA